MSIESNAIEELQRHIAELKAWAMQEDQISKLALERLGAYRKSQWALEKILDTLKQKEETI